MIHVLRAHLCECDPEPDVPHTFIETLAEGFTVTKTNNRFQAVNNDPSLIFSIEEDDLLHVQQFNTQLWIHCKIMIESSLFHEDHAEVIITMCRTNTPFGQKLLATYHNEITAWQVVWAPICDDLKRVVFGFLV